MHYKTIFSSAFLLVLGLGVSAQEGTLSAGSEASGSGGSQSYSLGQVVYSSFQGSGGSVSQGLQQAYQITVSVGEDLEYISLEVLPYPNPTTDYLYLKVESELPPRLRYQLFDAHGKLLGSGDATSNSQIEMQAFAKGVYFLNIQDKQQIVKSFQIIKN
jgi:hypothetical protein